MKNIKNLVLILLIICFGNVYSQNFKLRIDKVDTLNYPTIGVYFDAYKPNSEIIRGLTPKQIKVFEDNKEIRKINLLYKKLNKPIKLVILLDISRSMNGRKIIEAKKSIIELLPMLKSTDKVAFITFGSEVKIKSGFINDFSKIERLVNNINELSPKTHLYDAIVEGTKLFSKFDDSENFLLLITDGKDDGSYVPISEAISKLKEKNVNLFVLGIGNNLDDKTLGRLAYSTNGDFFHKVKIGNLRKVLKNEFEIISNSYVANYTTPDSLNEESNISKEVELVVNYNGIEKSISAKYVLPYRKPKSYLMYYMGGGLVFIAIVFIIIAWINRKRSDDKDQPIIVNEGEEIFQNEEGSELDFEVPGFGGNENFESAFDNDKTLNDFDKDFAQKVKEGKTVVISRKKNKQVETLGYLVMKSKIYGTNIYEVRDNEIIIGRSPQCDILLDDEEVSKLHTKIRVVDGVFYVDDLGSANGTFVNGKQEYHAELKDGDEIMIGEHKFIFKCV